MAWRLVWNRWSRLRPQPQARWLQQGSHPAAGIPPEENPPSSWAEHRPPAPSIQSHVHKVSLSTVPGSALPSQSTMTKPSVSGGGSQFDPLMQILCKYRPKSCLPTMLSCSMFFFVCLFFWGFFVLFCFVFFPSPFLYHLESIVCCICASLSKSFHFPISLPHWFGFWGSGLG
ncbi:hypothetical protein AOLI_G00004390 [Acnodon oligacanthus]